MAGADRGAFPLYLTALCAAFLRVPMVRALFSGQAEDFLTAFSLSSSFPGWQRPLLRPVRGKSPGGHWGATIPSTPGDGAAGCVQLALLRWGRTVFHGSPSPRRCSCRWAAVPLGHPGRIQARKLLFRGKNNKKSPRLQRGQFHAFMRFVRGASSAAQAAWQRSRQWLL